MLGKIEFDEEGKPICEICGKSFKRVMAHVRMKHELTAVEYKQKFGFDLGKGICSAESSELTREKTLENYETVIKKNLLKKGVGSRFQHGDKGRTKDKVSEQTKIRLKDNLKKPKMIEVMKISGSKLGKSGLGNKKRWGNENTYIRKN
jgi:hypothetical protein